MNVYDEAHTLSRAIKESEEFKQYDALKKRVDENEELSNTIKKFENTQMELQKQKLLGEISEEEAQRSMQNIYQVIMKDPLALEYIQAQIRFNLMMNDVIQIVSETMGLGNIL